MLLNIKQSRRPVSASTSLQKLRSDNIRQKEPVLNSLMESFFLVLNSAPPYIAGFCEWLNGIYQVKEFFKSDVTERLKYSSVKLAHESQAFIQKNNRRDGVVVRASASQSVDLGFISLVESYQKTLINGIHSFPAWRSAHKG